MAKFSTIAKNNKCTSLYIQGAKSSDSNSSISEIIFQNYDDDSKMMYNMAKIGMSDFYGNSNDGYGNLTFATNAGPNMTEVVRIMHNGSVGIGTITPSEKLDVHGGNITLGSSNYIIFKDSSGESVTTIGSDTLFMQNPLMSGDLTIGGRIRVTNNETLSTWTSTTQELTVAGRLRLSNNSTGSTYTMDPGSNHGMTTFFSSDSNLVTSSSTTLYPALSLTTTLGTGRYHVGITYQVYSLQDTRIRVTSDVNDAIWHDSVLRAEASTSETHTTFKTINVIEQAAYTFNIKFASTDSNVVGLSRSEIEIFQLQ